MTRLAVLGRFLVLLVVIDFRELGVDDIVLLGLAARGACIGAGARLLLSLLVHRFAKLHRSLRQRIGLGRDRIGVGTLQRLFQIGHGVLDRAALDLADLRAMLGQCLLRRMDQTFGVVLRLDLSLALLVILGVRLGVLHHLLDVGVAQATGRLDADLLLLAGAFVFGRHVD